MPRPRNIQGKIEQDAEKIDKERISEKISFDENLALRPWWDRIVKKQQYTKYLSDPRYAKAKALLASVVMGGGYKVSVRPKDALSTEDLSNIYRYIYKDSSLADTVESLSSKLENKAYAMELLAKNIPDEKKAQLALETRNSIASAEELNSIAVDLFDKARMMTLAFESIGEAVGLGDSFDEVVYNNQGVLSVEHLDIDRMLPRYGNKGIITKWRYLEKPGGPNAVVMCKDEVLRYSFNKINDLGRGLFFTTLNINYITHKMERLTAISRESRAVQMRLHYPDYQGLPEKALQQATILTEEQVKQHRNRVQSDFSTGYVIDYYSNGLWKVKTIENDKASINFIDDTEYFRSLFEVGLLVPPGVLDTGANVNRNTLDLQIKFLKGILKVLEDEVLYNLKKLIKIELYLKGYNLNDIEVDIKFDNTALIDLLEASQILARVNRFNDFPRPLVAEMMGYSWSQYIDAVQKQDASGVKIEPHG